MLYLCYLSSLFSFEPGIYSWLYVISRVCFSQSRASTSSCILSLWFIFLRTRWSLPALCLTVISGLFVLDPGIHLWQCYLSRVFISEAGIHSWFFDIPLVCLPHNQAYNHSSMLSLYFVYLRPIWPFLALCSLSGLFMS